MTLGAFEEALFKPFGLAPFPNASGEIRPRFVYLPDTVNPTTYTQVTAAKFRGRSALHKPAPLVALILRAQARCALRVASDLTALRLKEVTARQAVPCHSKAACVVSGGRAAYDTVCPGVRHACTVHEGETGVSGC